MMAKTMTYYENEVMKIRIEMMKNPLHMMTTEIIKTTKD